MVDRARLRSALRPIADISAMSETVRMYRKDAARHIVRDVRERLTDMRRKAAWVDWRMALLASQAAHPDWFRHDVTAESMEPLLREAGVDMSVPEKPFGFVGNEADDE